MILVVMKRCCFSWDEEHSQRYRVSGIPGRKALISLDIVIIIIVNRFF